MMKKRTKFLSVLLTLLLTATLAQVSLTQAFASETSTTVMGMVEDFVDNDGDDLDWDEDWDDEWDDDWGDATDDEPSAIPMLNLTISKAEVINHPTHTFTAPSFLKIAEDEEQWEEYCQEAEKPENTKNSIAYNMAGAKIAVDSKEEGSQVYTVTEDNLLFSTYMGITDEESGRNIGYIAFYRLVEEGYEAAPGMGDPIERSLLMSVCDLGNYKAEIILLNANAEVLYETEYTVPSNGKVENNTKPGTEESGTDIPKPSANGASSTKDTATGDSIVSGNGTVATGNSTVSVAVLTTILCALGVMLVIGRKKRMF